MRAPEGGVRFDFRRDGGANPTQSTADRSHHRESSKQAEREIGEEQRDNTILNTTLCGSSYQAHASEMIAAWRGGEDPERIAELFGLRVRCLREVSPAHSSS